VLPQLAISKHFTVNLHKSLIGALSFNFAHHRQLRQHAVVSWPSVHRHCQVADSECFRCFCPTVFVSVVGGEKIKIPKGGKKKIEFVLWWGRHTLCQVLACVTACATWQCV